MKRRVLLERFGAATAAGALAGCLDETTDDPGSGDDEDGDDGGGDADDDTDGNETGETGGDGDADEENETDERENDTTDEDTEDDGDEQGDGDARIGEEEITTTNADCGEGNEASITFADDAVEIEGGLTASDPCHEATLADVSVADDELDVTVGTERIDEEACAQCIARIDYEATVRFESEPPLIATVGHESDDGTEEVTRERREQ